MIWKNIQIYDNYDDIEKSFKEFREYKEELIINIFILFKLNEYLNFISES